MCEILNISEEDIYIDHFVEEDVDVLQIISIIITISKKNPKDQRLFDIQKILNE